MDYCMIEIAFGKKEEVDLVVNKLLEKKVAASCQVIESNSKWNWNNSIEEAKEYLLLIKTKKSLIEEIYNIVRRIHSYECFEFAIFNLTSCSQDYLNWIKEETK